MANHAARTATDLISHLTKALLSRLTVLTEGKYWFLTVGLGAVLLSWVIRLPEYYVLEGLPERVDSKFLAWQAQHPLTPNTEYLKPLPDYPPEEADIVSHLYKTSYRLTIPLLSRVLPFGIWAWIVLPGLSGLIFYPILCGVLAQFTGNRVTATLLTWNYAICSATQFFFGRFYILYGDGFAYLLLAVVALSNRPWLIFTSVCLSSFTDERALVATTILYFLRSLRDHTLHTWRFRALFPSNGAMWAMIAACFSYLIGRLSLHAFFGLENDDSAVLTSKELLYHLRYSIPDLLFATFEGLWVLPVLALLSAVAARNIQWVIAYIGALFFALAPSFLVIDLERSLGFMFPVLLAAVWALRGERLSLLQYVATGIFTVNLLWWDIKESMFLQGFYLLVGRDS